VEYVLAVALVALVAIGAYNLLGNAVETKVECAAAAIDGRGAPCGSPSAVAGATLGQRDDGPRAHRQSEQDRSGGGVSGARAGLTEGDRATRSSAGSDLASFGYRFEHSRHERVDGSTERYIGSGDDNGAVATLVHGDGYDELRVVQGRDEHVIRRDAHWTTRTDTTFSGTSKVVTSRLAHTGESWIDRNTTQYELCRGCLGADPDGYRAIASRHVLAGTIERTVTTYDEAAGTRTKTTTASGTRSEYVEKLYGTTWTLIEQSHWSSDGSSERKTYLYPNLMRHPGLQAYLIDHGHDGYDSIGFEIGETGQDSEYEISWVTDELTVYERRLTTDDQGVAGTVTTAEGHIDRSFLPSWVPFFGGDDVVIDSGHTTQLGGGTMSDGGVRDLHLDDNAVFQQLLQVASAIRDAGGVPPGPLN